ncbi:hypothetical protein [Marinobacterium stanieri]|uniref:Uncharacterized protein n=1 Tax=Marinobacterium stanieri TaxID=49186 RepID=A0A1N6TEJ6_9GAMM|nr:hypothetical protein [Marinobacterium stanieri]SIQ51526.1 hypothetical protein SAMN05421647_105283 [Marinobacterium stanieri]
MSNDVKPIPVVILGAISSLFLILTLLYILIAGFDAISTVILVSAFSGLAIPAVIYADGAIECVTGVFEMFAEGISAIFSGILDAIGSLFG